MQLPYTNLQDCFWIYSKILNFSQLLTFLKINLGLRYFTHMVQLPGEVDFINFYWSEWNQIWYAVTLHHSLGLLELYKKQEDPYLKSLRHQKARPKTKKLIMFCLTLSEIKVSPQKIIMFYLKLREIKVSPHFVFLFGVNDHLKGGRTLCQNIAIDIIRQSFECTCENHLPCKFYVTLSQVETAFNYQIIC